MREGSWRGVCCQIQHDIMMGLFARKREWIGCIFLVVFLAILYLVRVHQISSLHGLSSFVSCPDILVGLLGGQKEVARFDLGNIFDIPISWFVLYMTPLFLFTNYPLEDRKGCGYQYVIRCQKTDYWWLSKIVLLVLQTILYFGIIVCVCGVIGVMSGGGLDDFHPEIIELVDQVYLPHMSGMEILFKTIALPCCICIGIGVFGTVLSFVVGHVFYFLLMIVMMTASVYWTAPMLIGNYMMIYRLENCDIVQGLIYSVLIFLVGVVLGKWHLNHADFL